MRLEFDYGRGVAVASNAARELETEVKIRGTGDPGAPRALRVRYKIFRCVKLMVNQTCGNRFGLTGYRSSLISIWAGIKPAQIQNSNLDLKK